ncbi:Intradiol ring-cleavage dioxygenase [Cercophora scortea]|uniref:Intradiol ring-cleavage dioxygenase n=1 Tax=Cercophora scortea TaxID=314031 RepID=A0AAE0IAN3_9PEZI|nr:Intradiol ring-cleavage dioxygenase [Cercophora scortea]
MHFTSVLASALAATLVAGHPGHDHAAEALERRQIMSMMERKDLSHCAAKIKARGLEARSIARRNAAASKLLKRGNLLNGRDLPTLLNTTHHSCKSYNLNTPETTIFATNSSCILSPEVTEGPYYVAGEYIRENVVESEPGLPLHLDIQVLDMETCEPVTGAFLEIWHCNSTGVYSGVSANGNGNGAASNLNNTFLRGVQLTDADGVSQFDTLFPGHYTGRATHIHVMVHLNATARANGTVMDTTASHVGQFFFDQDLIAEVESLPVYVDNKQPLTLNADDNILADAAQTSDPFLQYVTLGSAVSDGLLGWIAFGINSTLARAVTQGATLYAEGGVTNEHAGGPGGGPGGPGGPPPGFPTGGFPGGPRPTSSAAPSATPLPRV